MHTRQTCAVPTSSVVPLYAHRDSRSELGRYEAALHGGDEKIAALLQATEQPVPAAALGPKRPRPPSNPQEKRTFPSLCTRVLGVHERYSDAGRSLPLAHRLAHTKAGQLNSRGLRGIESFIFKTGGCGMSAQDANEVWTLFDEWGSDERSEAGRPKKPREYIPSPHAMRQALADDIEEAVDADAWYSCKLTELDETYETYDRAALPEITLALTKTLKVRYWAKGDESEGPSDYRELHLTVMLSRCVRSKYSKTTGQMFSSSASTCTVTAALCLVLAVSKVPFSPVSSRALLSLFHERGVNACSAAVSDDPTAAHYPPCHSLPFNGVN